MSRSSYRPDKATIRGNHPPHIPPSAIDGGSGVSNHRRDFRACHYPPLALGSRSTTYAHRWLGDRDVVPRVHVSELIRRRERVPDVSKCPAPAVYLISEILDSDHTRGIGLKSEVADGAKAAASRKLDNCSNPEPLLTYPAHRESRARPGA